MEGSGGGRQAAGTWRAPKPTTVTRCARGAGANCAELLPSSFPPPPNNPFAGWAGSSADQQQRRAKIPAVLGREEPTRVGGFQEGDGEWGWEPGMGSGSDEGKKGWEQEWEAGAPHGQSSAPEPHSSILGLGCLLPAKK